MIDERCKVCRTPDMRRLIELGWNARMSAPDIANGVGQAVGSAVILKHLKEHVEGGAFREVPVVQAAPMRNRVLAIQKLQVEEIERRLELAQEKAAKYNAENAGVEGFEPVDWSFYFDILGKDMQAAVASIIKTQALQDKHETVERGQKIDLFKALTAGGRPPAGLIGPGGGDD